MTGPSRCAVPGGAAALALSGAGSSHRLPAGTRLNLAIAGAGGMGAEKMACPADQDIVAPAAGCELQILDGWRDRPYVNGQAGSIYKQQAPLANPARPPGGWQQLDVTWTAPLVAADGALRRPARVSVRPNGVPVQRDAVLAGETVFVGVPRDRPHGRLPIKLQDHRDPGAPISFRNIRVVERP